jgi:hypothetical protein
MQASMTEAADRCDLRDFNADMAGWMMGWAAQQQELDTSRIPERIGERMRQAQAQMASMTLDGLGDEARREVYSSAFVDALEAMDSRYPALGESWSRQYGDDWRSFMKQAVHDPQGAARGSWTAAGGFRQHGGTGPEEEQDTPDPDTDFQPC